MKMRILFTQKRDDGHGCLFGFDRNLSKKCPYGYGVSRINELSTQFIEFF